MTTQPLGDRPRVSVVIPVYNTVDYLAECLDALVDQDLPAADLQVVAVDDGSTDGSADVLDDYASRYSNVDVIHQPNSGWPGQPRNRGIDASRGHYVFFLDSDDRLAPEALQQMCDFADAYDSDIVVPRQVTHDGARGRIFALRATEVDADVRDAFKMLGPQKLIRRSLLDEHHVRFPEGKVRLEDGIFITRAYLLARRISMLADGDYYVKRMRDDGANISKQPALPDDYIGSVGRIAAAIRELSGDRSIADDLVLFVYRRKALRRLKRDMLPSYRPKRRLAWVQQIGQLADTYVTAEMESRLEIVERLQSAFARRRDVDTLLHLAAVQAGDVELVVVSESGRIFLELPAGRGPEVTGLVGPDDASVRVLEPRQVGGTHRVLRRLMRSLTHLARRGDQARLKGE